MNTSAQANSSDKGRQGVTGDGRVVEVDQGNQVMESSISQQFEERRPDIQEIDSPIMGDIIVGMENHIPNFEEHLANIDAGITRFEDKNGREDRIGPQIFPITSPNN